MRFDGGLRIPVLSLAAEPSRYPTLYYNIPCGAVVDLASAVQRSPPIPVLAYLARVRVKSPNQAADGMTITKTR
jgi:hypothetical protein